MSRLKALRHPYVAFVFRLAVAAVFLYAGVAKALDPKGFGVEIARYRILPLDLVNFVAITLPWVEIVAGLLLVLGLFARGAALLCSLLMLVFIAALVSALSRGLDISCGCFGGGDSAAKISRDTLLRDLLWLFWAGHAALFDEGVLGLDRLLTRRRERRARSQSPAEVDP